MSSAWFHLLRLTRLRGHQTAARAVWISASLAAGSIFAQTPEEIEAQIQEGLQNAQELLENLPTLRQIEADEAAMRGLLNQTQDDLQAERARTAALEAQLQGLTGPPANAPLQNGTRSATAIATTTPQPPSAESSRWVTLPPRRVNALGMLDTAAQSIGRVPEGTEAWVPRWPTHVALPEGVAWPRADIQASQTRLIQPGALGQERVLGVFELRGNQVYWSWRAGADSGVAANDAWLEPLLRRTRFEAQRAGVALESFQVTPTSHRLPQPLMAQGTLTMRLREHLGIAMAGAGVSLVVEADGPMQRLEADSSQAAWVGPTQSLWVRLLPEDGTLTVRTSPGLDARLAAIERQRLAWERDLQNTTAEVSVREQARAELERLEAAAEELQTLIDAIPNDVPSVDAAATLGVASVSAPIVRLIDPQSGVVLARLSLSPLMERNP
ncbi:MAG: hypothetical protein AAF328_12105 [Planctomycetota bacterium]